MVKSRLFDFRKLDLKKEGSAYDLPIALGILCASRPFINTRSFIDYFIVNEFARNVDGFKKSRNFYKDKSSKDSLIYACDEFQ
ncbi:hypothetical protein N9K77_00365 [bacterium]|nr:hypothetical protein [bacterium]